MARAAQTRVCVALDPACQQTALKRWPWEGVARSVFFLAFSGEYFERLWLRLGPITKNVTCVFLWQTATNHFSHSVSLILSRKRPWNNYTTHWSPNPSPRLFNRYLTGFAARPESSGVLITFTRQDNDMHSNIPCLTILRIDNMSV